MSGYRYHARRAVTGEWLDRDLQIYGTELTWTLSGPSAMQFKADPILAKQKAPDGLLVLDEWATLIFAEKDDEIRWGGIVVNSNQEDETGVRGIECVGYAGYPKGRIFDLADYYRIWEARAYDVVELLWDFVQLEVYGDLGVQIERRGDPPGYLGDPGPGEYPVQQPGESTTAFQARVVEWTNWAGEPYQLAWWNTTDCGDEIDRVMQEADADYVEEHYWLDDDKTDVGHRIILGYPSVGTRRNDLRFVEGENVIVPPRPSRNGEAYANRMYAIGAGEERHMLRQTAGLIDPFRLRRDKFVAAKDSLSPSYLKKLAEDNLKIANDILFFDGFTIVDHPNAPVGSFRVGDQIRVQTHSGYETLDRWCLITEISISPDNSDEVSVSVTRL